MSLHYVASIRALGTPDGYSTESPERYHCDYAKDAYRASNRVNYLTQMTKWLGRQDAIRNWSAYMAWARPPEDPPPEDPDESDVEDDDKAEYLTPEELSSIAASDIPTITSPVTLDVTYPRPALVLAQRARIPRKPVHWVSTGLGIDPDVFLSSINDFIKSSVPFSAFQLMVTRDHYLDFWTRARLIHPADSLPTLDASVTETLVCRAPKTSPTGRSSPGLFSTALLLVKDGAKGILRYRVVRIRAIFTLPDHVYGVLPQHLAYVEYFSPFPATPPRAKLKQYTVTPSLRTNGTRVTSVVPLKNIKLSCHLTPHFQRMEEDDWKDVDLVGTFTHFYLNDFSSHIMYGYMREWDGLD